MKRKDFIKTIGLIPLLSVAAIAIAVTKTSFKDELLKIAKLTKQTRYLTTYIARGFSELGYSEKETLKKTGDTLILVRLTELSIKEAVEIVESPWRNRL